MQFSFEHGKLTFVANSEEDILFLRQLRHSFFEGSVQLRGFSHRVGQQCIECLASERYKDCVTAEAAFSIEQPTAIISPRMIKK